MKARLLILAALALIPVAANAHDDAHQGMKPGMTQGKPGDPKKVSRTIQVLMSDDMKFTPAKVNVQRGETVKFVVRNAGKVKHEMIIGSMAELKQHAELMRRMPGMEHDEPNQVALDPGRTGTLVWQFTNAGTVDFACLQPGHFEAGMMGKVSVR